MDYERRVKELVEAWAPPHARELMDEGWRLSAGTGLVWVRNDKPGLRLSDERARELHEKRAGLRRALMNARSLGDSWSVGQLELELAELPTYEGDARG